MPDPIVEAGDVATVTVRVPMSFRRRGGRKLLIAADSTAAATRRSPSAAHPVTPAVKALARALRWRRLLESGAYATIQDLARAERINPSYVSRVLRLTLLAPKTVEGVLDGRLQLSLAQLMRPVPIEWLLQRA